MSHYDVVILTFAYHVLRPSVLTYAMLLAQRVQQKLPTFL